MKYRLLGKSGLRVSEAALGTMTFGDDWGWGSPKDEAQKSMRPTARQVETSLTRQTSTPTARAKDSWVSSFIVIARA
jgi:aryl-alcohol dehydrogenase-like predicted oxidoreductase